MWCFEGVGLKLTEPKMLPTVEQAAETVVQWRERVRWTMPKSQLLEFKVTDGWKPLCDFLEVQPGKRNEKQRENNAKPLNGANAIFIFFDNLHINMLLFYLF